jgi:hypothetical protein
MAMRIVRTFFGLLASWAVLAVLAVLMLVSLGGAGTWLSPSGFAKRQPTYGAPTRVAAPTLPYRSSDRDDEQNHAALAQDAAVAKLRLKAEDQDLRSHRAAKPRPKPDPGALATSRGASVGDRHSSNF